MVYTAITGGKDRMRRDVKCFTDDFGMKNKILAAKIYKVLFWLFVQSEWSIWVDGNIFLKVKEDDLIDMTKPYDIGVFPHPRNRDCVYQEAEICIKEKKDNPEIIKKQMKYYRLNGYPEHNGLAMCGVIVRRNTKEVRNLCREWMKHILVFSIRDQLSFPVVFQDRFKYLPAIPGYKNDYFIRRNHVY